MKGGENISENVSDNDHVCELPPSHPSISPPPQPESLLLVACEKKKAGGCFCTRTQPLTTPFQWREVAHSRCASSSVHIHMNEITCKLNLSKWRQRKVSSSSINGDEMFKKFVTDSPRGEMCRTAIQWWSDVSKQGERVVCILRSYFREWRLLAAHETSPNSSARGELNSKPSPSPAGSVCSGRNRLFFFFLHIAKYLFQNHSSTPFGLIVLNGCLRVPGVL